MNRLEHLLTILTEECAEVQQAATKLLRFGADEGRDMESEHFSTNVERLRYEINDMIAMVEMLEREGLDLSPDHANRASKKEKVEKYLLYSLECGTLQQTREHVTRDEAQTEINKKDEVVTRLRGQLQNCVDHLGKANRKQPRQDYLACIDSANKALYETL